jgi:hypothetical protein
MPRILKRIALSSSVFAVVGVFVCAGPVRLAAQGARARGAGQEVPSGGGQAAPSGGGQAVPRGGERAVPSGGERAVPRAGERATRSEARAPQAESRRAEPSPRAEPSRGEGAATRVPPPRRAEFPTATAVPRTVPRTVPQGPGYRSGYQGSNYRREYQPNYRQLYRPDYRQSYRPYYTFRPRVRLGFGLWIGYPVTYPTYFYPATPYPYAYSSPYPGAYPMAIYPAPGTTASVGAAGGLSFDITPAEAGVYVDGYYMGPVAQFTPNQPPLALAPGRHHVEIREPGFEVIAFDVDILPGQVIPYQGDLRRF